jgi:HEAT repeat protein
MIRTIMGKYDIVRDRFGWGPPEGEARRSPADIPQRLALSTDPDPKVRRVAAKNLCPCHLRVNDARAWDRLIALSRDPDPGVRSDAVHALGDGSPRALKARVVEALCELQNDPDGKVRKQVRRVLSAYRRSGRVNVL